MHAWAVIHSCWCELRLTNLWLRPMSQGYGYGIVLGFGLFFSIFTSLIVFMDYRFGLLVTTR